MQEKSRWSNFRQWHELLDAVCIEDGHNDNMALANDLSAALGNRSGEAFEAVQKNLRNWRAGIHLPQRRNFIVLTKVLRINSREGLKEHWRKLYAEARQQTVTETLHSGDPPTKKSVLTAAVVVIVAVLMIGAGYLFKADSEVVAQEGQMADVEYRKAVKLNVGEFAVVHGARGKCNEDPPAWEKVLSMLPELDIGYWSDGNVGTRYSRKCGGPTSARGVVFNATGSGQADVTVFGDPVKIEVH
jgi:hypothetical protein